MFRNSARATARLSRSSSHLIKPTTASGRRFLTTAPPHAKSRGWKNGALRWGIAVAGIYYYNTSPLFAEYPQNNLLNPNLDALDDHQHHQTVEQLTASSRNKANKDRSILQSAIETTSEKDALHRQENDGTIESLEGHNTPQQTTAAVDGAAELEQEADSEGAFNPVTGEINWDCPCLGGMAHGPCGPEFREAFSCFVYSNEEPKGMECIEKFSNMQTCFREHPEHYKDELDDDNNDELDAELAHEKEELNKEIAERRAHIEAQQKTRDQTPDGSSGLQNSKNKSDRSKASRSTKSPQPEAKTTSHTPDEYSTKKESENGAPSRIIGRPQVKETSSQAQPESESLVPKASHDATDMTSGDSFSVAK